MIKIVFLGLVALLSGLLSPMQGTSINLTPENELIIFETTLDGRLSVAELSGLSPPKTNWSLSASEIANETARLEIVVEPSLVNAWSKVGKHADLRVNTKFLENISGYSDDLLKQLDDDLLNPKWADELKAAFKESPADVDIWKQLKDDPALSWEISKTNPDWQRWGQREFFKDVTALGKRFEEVSKTKILNKSSDLYTSLKSSLNGKGLNIDDYEIFSQVQLKYSGDNYFVGDIIMIRKEVNALTGQVKTKAVILETKLRNTTNLTSPQTNALNKVKGSDKSLITRSENLAGAIDDTNILTKNSTIEVEDFIKVWGDGSGEAFSGLNSLVN